MKRKKITNKNTNSPTRRERVGKTVLDKCDDYDVGITACGISRTVLPTRSLLVGEFVFLFVIFFLFILILHNIHGGERHVFRLKLLPPSHHILHRHIRCVSFRCSTNPIVLCLLPPFPSYSVIYTEGNGGGFARIDADIVTYSSSRLS